MRPSQTSTSTTMETSKMNMRSLTRRSRKKMKRTPSCFQPAKRHLMKTTKPNMRLSSPNHLSWTSNCQALATSRYLCLHERFSLFPHPNLTLPCCHCAPLWMNGARTSVHTHLDNSLLYHLSVLLPCSMVLFALPAC